MATDSQQTLQSRSTFVHLLTSEQTRLFSYITMLVGDLNDASNVLQQTNMVLWQKADEFTDEFVGEAGFSMWSRKIAYYNTLSYIRDKKRDKHIFDDELLRQIAAQPMAADEDERRVALRHCLGSLSEDSLELVRQRYWPGSSIQQLAKRRRKSESAVKMALMRIRQTLGDCIERQMVETP